MTTHPCVNKKNYFLNQINPRFLQKKGLIFKESLTKKKNLIKQNNFLETHP